MSEQPLSQFESPRQYSIPFRSQSEINRKDLKDIQTKVQLPKEKDPWGDNIPGVVLFVIGDSHIPRAEPKDEVTMNTHPYSKISRLDPRNPKRYTQDRQVRFADTWFAEVQELKQQMEISRPSLDAGYIPVVVHVGDRGADAELRGDMQNAFWTIGSGISSLADEDPRLKAAILPGDHEFDRQRHGNKVYKEEMRLLGEKPAFFQRVGKEHLLLGLTTSLADNSSDEQFNKWKTDQENLIREATATALLEGRKIILLGHKENVLMEIADKNHMPTELIEAVFAGHKHKGNLKKDEGGTIHGTVGAPTVGAFGLEVNTVPSFIRAEVGEKGVKTTSIEVHPEKIQGLM